MFALFSADFGPIKDKPADSLFLSFGLPAF